MAGIVILDRDGVINRDSDAYIKSVAEWQPLPGAIEAIARLGRAGFRVAIATNQSGIGRGYYDHATLAAIHRRLTDLVVEAGGLISHVEYCPHHPDEGCVCRKPAPGMLFAIQHTLDLVDLRQSWMVGDSLRDIDAGARAGCHTALVRTGKGASCEATVRSTFPEAWVCDDLADFVSRLTDSKS
ncbi:D-glycero-beta-D-manno-heptose 1,7-bisphosphate 7-phosphatase [Salinicola halophilus]|uniref:D-glycero-beta-D-manno-heptose 1,7-bisphosphate 7-phosphatase n=1 Tax=Salinicola halophilus TaxID=184065 RepID=UPI000DA1FC46|nr:D-glycero-beta-D-manno-heptose 1,7-bisphosphate 7-phosphatase [Salinicola halophilus]